MSIASRIVPSIFAIAIVTLGATASAGTIETPIRTHFGNGEIRSEIVQSADGKDILMRKYDEDGELVFEEWVKSGFTKFDEGNMRCEGNAKNGTVRCEHHNFGILRYTPYKGYLIHGRLRSLSESGQDYRTFRLGKLHGKAVSEATYYGTTAREVTHYKDGKEHGKHSYYEKGELIRLITWKDGFVDGRCVERHKWREREGTCHNDMESFTGVEKEYHLDSIPRTRKGKTTYAEVRQLAVIRHYKEGKVTKEKKLKLKDRSSRGAGEHDDRKQKRAEEKAKTLEKRTDDGYGKLDLVKRLPASTETITRTVSKKTLTSIAQLENPFSYHWTISSAYVLARQAHVLGLQPDDIVLSVNDILIHQWDWDTLACLQKEASCTYRIFRKGGLVDVVLKVTDK